MRRHGRQKRNDGALRCLPVPIHENGILGASMVSGQRFHGGGAGRSSDFGLPTPLPLPISIKTVRWRKAEQRFVPITAAGQRSIRTSFPFNRPPRGGLTCTWPFLHSSRKYRSSLATEPERAEA